MEGSSSRIQKTDNDRFTINFSSAGESLSDMIFKSSRLGRTHFAPMAPTMSTDKQELDLEMEPHEDEPLKRNRPHANETDQSRIQNFARIRATETKASLTLSSDSSSGMSAVSNSSSSIDCEELEEFPQPPQQQGLLGKAESQEGIVVGLAMVVPETNQDVFSKEKSGRDPRREYHDSSPDSTPDSALKQFSDPTIPTRQSSCEHSFQAPVSRVNLNAHAYEDQGIHPHDYVLQSNIDIPDDSQPTMQPNSSDSSHSLSSMSTKSTRSKSGDEDHAPYNYAQLSVPVVPSTTTTFTAAATIMTSAAPSPTPSARPKPSLASFPLRYWRDRTSGPSSSIAHSTDSSTSSSFAQNYLTSTFSKKKKLQIPTIVIHPDEEDGEPPRVLSQKDIEYLSTMPPAPLRPLFQPWDEILDEGDPDHMINEGYDYDDFQHPMYHHDREMGGIEEEDEEEFNDEEYGDSLEHEDAMDDLPHDVFGASGCDPYAFDVPIDLDVDLQGLERGDIKAELQDN
ncbi:hypothetical protein BGZ81_004476 [Podila clonocystis]|nr:hypothetical protein BGZ81_004476 [Podila clonocystis]